MHHRLLSCFSFSSLPAVVGTDGAAAFFPPLLFSPLRFFFFCGRFFKLRTVSTTACRPSLFPSQMARIEEKRRFFFLSLPLLPLFPDLPTSFSLSLSALSRTRDPFFFQRFPLADLVETTSGSPSPVMQSSRSARSFEAFSSRTTLPAARQKETFLSSSDHPTR